MYDLVQIVSRDDNDDTYYYYYYVRSVCRSASKSYYGNRSITVRPSVVPIIVTCVHDRTG